MSDIGNFIFAEAVKALANRVPVVNKLLNSITKNAANTSATYQREVEKGYNNAKKLSTDELAEKLKNRKDDSPMMKGMALEYRERIQK